MTSAELDALLASFAALARQEDGRIKCSLTGHVLPARVEAVRAYTSGARFQRRSAEAAALASLLAATDPPGLLAPSRNFPGRLFCSLTCHLVNAKPAAVASHLAGKKLAAARKAVAAGELEAMSEPDLPSSEGEEEGEEGEEGGGGDDPGPRPGVRGEEEAGGGGEAAPGKNKGKAKKAGAAAAPATKQKKKKKAAAAAKAPGGGPPPATPAVVEEPAGGGLTAAAGKARAARPSRPKRVKR